MIDWHNFGFSLLAMRFGAGSRLARWAERYELRAGRRADGAFCVSRAMQRELRARGVCGPLEVVPDSPLTLEPPLDRQARRDLLRRLLPDAPAADLVLLCPTSWTADEDIGVLLEALALHDAAGVQTSLLALITGQGPLRPAFERRIAALRLERTAIRTLFLAPADYRALLRAADVGVSLHRSSSGVDLPMKIIDFFGARTPVLALDYGDCLAEQVRDGVDGHLFADAAALARLLRDVSEPARLEQLRRNQAGDRRLWSEAAAAGWESLQRAWRA